jgi:hypothetical protein
MACGCGGGNSEKKSDGQWEVKLPNGEVRIVESEHAAKVATTIAGGGTYSRR